MALPMDFWRSEHNLNIFRTKPCQRLMKDGICEWRSQCQFSHCAGWPRRPPMRHKYSPEICPNIQKILCSYGAVQIKNCCTQGFKCQWAHSKEEILFHPQIFKTILCEEYESGIKKRTSKRDKKCHRYYCPFAHGQQELRTSELTLEQRKSILTGLDMFPSDKCCNACALPCTVAPVPPQVRAPAVDALESMPPPFPQQGESDWLFCPLSRPMPNLLQGDLAQERLRQSLPTLPSSAFGHDPFPRGKAPGKVNNTTSLTQNGTDDKWKALGSPAFVKISDDGFAEVGPWEMHSDRPIPRRTKEADDCSIGFSGLQSQEPLKTLEQVILKELVYTML
mmetsp:Transcript_105969/g.167277  ORF Transcript_105969/g.167277 Transcript_105969/m.167277 type:complete len:336 (-) Transcript_105969:478-1485(-)